VENFPLNPLGKILVIAGLFIVLVGVIFIFTDKLPMIGKLPGDIVVKKKNFTFYFPLTTLIILNLVLWFFFWLFGKFKGN
jgi:hypothetical protein